MTRSLGFGARLLAVALLGGATGACKSSTPIDMYFGTDAGAAFEAPMREVHPGEGGQNDDADTTGSAGTTGAAGTTGSAGTAGGGSGGTSGTNGGAGTTGSGGDGSAGTAGTGS